MSRVLSVPHHPDIGGQDARPSAGWAVADFQMNDRCAAGTGKFLRHGGAMGLSWRMIHALETE